MKQYLSYYSLTTLAILAFAILFCLLEMVLAVQGSHGFGYHVVRDAHAGSISITILNPLSEDTVDGLLVRILTTIQGIVATLALVFLVVGALIYITSAGNEQRMTLAKGAITAAIIGLALALAAPSFLLEIYQVLGRDTPAAAAGSLTLTEIALNVLRLLLSLVGIIAITAILVGAILYMTAAGDEQRITVAKKTINLAAIGLIIALTSLVIVTQIAATIAGA